MTVKRIVANMLTAEPGLAKPFYGGIFDMHPVIGVLLHRGRRRGLWRMGGEAGRLAFRGLF
ncbi:hypothetical protein [uncultured Bosea sp.]|uniref:hypothetical protein n=1 Tax=uncultured Bosea sp. TaxID=211457 RepID=UPI0025E4243C|nr:hypothetical protein [uncultured Bosea sp.]